MLIIIVASSPGCDGLITGEFIWVQGKSKGLMTVLTSFSSEGLLIVARDLSVELTIGHLRKIECGLIW